MKKLTKLDEVDILNVEEIWTGLTHERLQVYDAVLIPFRVSTSFFVQRFGVDTETNI